MPLWETSCSDARDSVAPALCVCISGNWFLELIRKGKKPSPSKLKGMPHHALLPKQTPSVRKKETFSEMRYGVLCLCYCSVHM